MPRPGKVGLAAEEYGGERARLRLRADAVRQDEVRAALAALGAAVEFASWLTVRVDER